MTIPLHKANLTGLTKTINIDRSKAGLILVSADPSKPLVDRFDVVRKSAVPDWSCFWLNIKNDFYQIDGTGISYVSDTSLIPAHAVNFRLDDPVNIPLMGYPSFPNAKTMLKVLGVIGIKFQVIQRTGIKKDGTEWSSPTCVGGVYQKPDKSLYGTPWTIKSSSSLSEEEPLNDDFWPDGTPVNDTSSPTPAKKPENYTPPADRDIDGNW
jgi:hypothetical protein